MTPEQLIGIVGRLNNDIDRMEVGSLYCGVQKYSDTDPHFNLVKKYVQQAVQLMTNDILKRASDLAYAEYRDELRSQGRRSSDEK